MKTMLFEALVAQDEKNQKIKWNNFWRKVTELENGGVSRDCLFIR